MDHRSATHVVSLAAAIRADIEALTTDEEVVRDTLEGEVDLDGLLDHLLLGIDTDEAMVDAISVQMERLEARTLRLQARVTSQKSLIRRIMEVAGWGLVRERPLATVSLDKKPACLGKLDESKIPANFWLQPDPVLDRKSLLKALKNKETIPGATLADSDVVLRIRRG